MCAHDFLKADSRQRLAMSRLTNLERAESYGSSSFRDRGEKDQHTWPCNTLICMSKNWMASSCGNSWVNVRPFPRRLKSSKIHFTKSGCVTELSLLKTIKKSSTHLKTFNSKTGLKTRSSAWSICAYTGSGRGTNQYKYPFSAHTGACQMIWMGC